MEPTPPASRRAGGFVVLAAVLFHLAGNLAWLRLDCTVPTADEAHHLRQALRCLELFRREPLARALAELPHADVAYPPIPHLAGAAGMAVLGEGREAPMAVSLGWLALLGLATWELATRWGGAGAGAPAVLLLLGMPVVYTQTRTFLPELPLAAMTALALAVLVTGGCFASSGGAAGFGVVSGLGLLTKYTFPVYVAGPALAALAVEARKPGRARAAVGHAAISAFLAAAIALPWYAVQWRQRLDWLRNACAMTQQPFPSSWHDPLGLGFYPLGLCSFPGMPTYLLLAAGGLVAARRQASRAMLWVWLAVPWVVLTATPIKWVEYFLPALAPAAIAASIGLKGWFGSSESASGGRAAVAAAVLGVLLYLPVSFGIDRYPRPGDPRPFLVQPLFLGPGREIRTRLLGLGPDADAGFFKSDWYGYAAAAYPLERVVQAIGRLPPRALVAVHPDSVLGPDRETFEWAAQGRRMTQRFVGLGETRLYDVAQLEGLVVHSSKPELAAGVPFDALAADQFPEQLSAMRKPQEGWPRLSLVDRIPTLGSTIHVFRVRRASEKSDQGLDR